MKAKLTLTFGDDDVKVDIEAKHYQLLKYIVDTISQALDENDNDEQEEDFDKILRDFDDELLAEIERIEKLLDEINKKSN